MTDVSSAPKDLIQSEKELSRPSQEEAGFKALAGDDSPSCASCRWFKADGGNHPFGYCHVIQNTPLDVSEKSVCDRHEPDPVIQLLATREVVVESIDSDVVPIEGITPSIPAPTIETTPEPAVVLMDETLSDKAVDDSANPFTERHVLLGILERVEAKIKALLNRNDGPEQTSLHTGLKVAGNHWFIVWSNNFEDREGEIFTAKAMDDYVRRVDAGVVAPPDLVLWHMGLNTKMGKADWVARHGHFLIAAGQFDATPLGAKAKAYYRRHARKTAVSHGYTYPAKSFDGRHYHAFNTFEISLLPRGKEANPFTSLERIKAMPITPEKEQYVREVFGEAADSLLAPLDELGKSLEAMGVEFKDFTAMPEAAAPSTAPSTAPVETETETDVKALANDLLSDLVADTAQIAQWTVTMGKAFKDNKDAFDARFNDLADLNAQYKARLDEQAADIAALKAQLDSRPKSASKAEETTLDVARLEAISKHADSQTLIRDSFFGTEYPAYPASTLNGA